MTSTMIIFGWVLVVLLILWFVLIFVLRIRRSISKADKTRLIKKLNHISGKDVEAQIYAYDKLLGEVLGAMGYNGTVADRIRGASKSNILNKKATQHIWRVHKYRNKLAHNDDFSPSQSQMEQVTSDFHQFILALLR